MLAASTVAVPIVATLIRPQRMEPKLLVARDWLSKNGNLITAVMLFMIGVVNVGDSLTRL